MKVINTESKIKDNIANQIREGLKNFLGRPLTSQEVSKLENLQKDILNKLINQPIITYSMGCHIAENKCPLCHGESHEDNK